MATLELAIVSLLPNTLEPTTTTRDGLAVSDSPHAHCTGLITVSLFRVVSKSINTLQAPYIKADSVQQIEGEEKDTTERLEIGPPLSRNQYCIVSSTNRKA